MINVENPEDSIESEWHGFGMDTQDKAIGKAYSYAYKYFLLKTFALETGDEDIEADREDFTKSTLKGNAGIDDDIRLEMEERFFDDTKEKLLNFSSEDEMKKFWEKNWKNIGKLPTERAKELINIKNNMKLKFEGKL
jgi:hypothetical protein